MLYLIKLINKVKNGLFIQVINVLPFSQPHTSPPTPDQCKDKKCDFHEELNIYQGHYFPKQILAVGSYL